MGSTHPQTWKVLWFVFIASRFQASYSVVNLPSSALVRELTASVVIRSRLVSARFTGSVLASLIALVLGASLSHQGASGYWQIGVISGVLLTIGSLVRAVGLTPAAMRCKRPEAHQPSLLPQLGHLLGNGFFSPSQPPAALDQLPDCSRNQRGHCLSAALGIPSRCR